MANPWLKKNPLASIWLSAANRVAGAMRGHVTAQVRRQLKAGVAASTSPRSPKARPGRKP